MGTINDVRTFILTIYSSLIIIGISHLFMHDINFTWLVRSNIKETYLSRTMIHAQAPTKVLDCKSGLTLWSVCFVLYVRTPSPEIMNHFSSLCFGLCLGVDQFYHSSTGRRNNKFRVTRSLIKNPVKLKLWAFSQDNLCSGEDLEVANHMTWYRRSVVSAQGHVKVTPWTQGRYCANKRANFKMLMKLFNLKSILS